MCILFHPSCFSLLSPHYKFLECLNTVPCSKFVSRSFIVFTLGHYFFATSQYLSLSFFHLPDSFKRRKNGEVFVRTILLSLFSWLKLVYPKYAFPTKVWIYWGVFSTYKQKDKLSHRKGCYVGIGHKTGFKCCIFKGTF